MENQIYIFYNKLSLRYEGVFSFPTDAVCMARLSKKGSFDRSELEVCKVGSYNLETGVITSFSPVRLEIPLEEDDPLPVTEAK